MRTTGEASPLRVRRGYTYLLRTCATLLCCAVAAQAGSTIHVSPAGANSSPFASWATAATNINVAVAAAAVGDTVLVTNGSYAVTNQLQVSGFTLCSVNGPYVTTLYRPSAETNRIIAMTHSNAYVAGITFSNASAANIYGCGQCLEMSAGTVSNCVFRDCPGSTGLQAGVFKVSGGLITHSVISNNQSRSWVIGLSGSAVVQDSLIYGNHTPYDPAALRCEANAVVRRCRLIRNSAAYGSNARTPIVVGAGGTLENCLIWGSTSVNGGTVEVAAGSRMLSCTVVSNSGKADAYAVLASGSITNCIIYHNDMLGQVSSTATPRYSCAPELTTGVNGNRADNPKLVNYAAGDCHLDFGSPCVDAGTSIGVTVDIDGTNRDSRVDIGAFERVTGAGPLLASFVGSPLTGVGSVTSVFTVVLEGGNTNLATVLWDFDNDGAPEETGGTELLRITHAFPPGRHSVALRVQNTSLQWAGYTNLNYVTVQSAGNDVYVSTNGSATFPYDTWAKSTANFEDAFRNATHAGSTVWVSNGAYGVSAQLTMDSNKSVCGAGDRDAVILYRNSAGYFPMFALTHAGARVSGLTITNACGAGAGACFTMSAGTVSNCVLTKTQIGIYPDKVFGMTGGLVTHCLLTNNSPRSHSVDITGGVFEDSVVTASLTGHDQAPVAIGYDRFGGVVRRCRIVNIQAPGNIPGAVRLYGTARLENCLVSGNKGAASAYGAVLMDGGVMVNCTVVSNSTVTGAAGVTRNSGVITNCIVYGNDPAFPNYTGSVAAVWNSCVPGVPAGEQGNVTGDPLFEDVRIGDYRLARGSPCVDSGADIGWTKTDVDLGGIERVKNKRVDMGCFESLPPGGTIVIVR